MVRKMLDGKDRIWSENRSSLTGKLTQLLACLLWFVFVGSGYLFLLFYERSPGPDSNPPSTWPIESKLKRVSGEFTLVMFIHPKCPCTSATLSELAVLMTQCQQMKAYVLVLRPSGFPANWEKTGFWYRANTIPRVTVLSDLSGGEAETFNARTSGETVLYDGNGKLVFCGGITGARGHEGDNQGLDAIQAIVTHTNTLCHKTAVFGCSLLDPPSTTEAPPSCRQ